MSVRVADRKEGNLQVLDLALRLCIHTLGMCKSDRFPKRDRWLLAKPIAEDAVRAYSSIKAANGTPLKEGPTLEQDYRFRRQMQLEARAAMNSLLGNMHVAYEVYKKNGSGFDGMEHWTRLATQTNDKLKRWMTSDLNRYLDLMRGQR